MITFSLPNNLKYNLINDNFNKNISKTDVLRYLRGIYDNIKRFKHAFIKQLSDNKNLKDICDYFIDNYKDTNPFSYEEAFKIKDREFQSIVFGSIDIVEMINSLGCKRIKVDGIPVKRKQFSEYGEFLGYKEYDNIYETYEVSGKKLGLNNNVYVIKVWCTSTNKEHWLWIEEKYKDNPLEAVASTFRIHENIIPHIKELKRQGDIMIVELNKDINPEGNIVPLTSKQYFDLLTTET